MKKYLLLITIGLFFVQQIIAQDFTGFLMSDSLVKNTNSIIKEYRTVFTQNDINSGTEKVIKSIIVFNETGRKNASIFIPQDKFRELTDFSGIIKNAGGTVIKKIKKNDLTTTSFSGEFASDNKYSLYEFQSPSYPFTIEYSYQMKYKNGILSYPQFIPTDNYSEAVLKAEYQIEIPSDINIRLKVLNCDIPVNKTIEANGKKTYSFKITNMKAINNEPYSPSFHENCPIVLVGPDNFCYNGYCGNMNDWNNYGKWVSNLLTGREQLTPELTEKIKTLTEKATTEKEKAKIIYEYLQKNTRYVSIQLGIGGFQPAPAINVAKTGFGDCKGLSNLMKAMLNTVGIPSNYCEIQMDNKEKALYSDFANVFQTNHAILCIPFKNDTTWLECTSGTSPFGFIHEGISGHDALVITENGGKLYQLPSYPDSLNKSVCKMDIILSEDGNASGKTSLNNSIYRYMSIADLFESNNTKEQSEYLVKFMKLGKVKIQNISSTSYKSANPEITVKYEFISEGFANKSGSRLFAPICPVKKGNYKVFSSTKREYDILFNEGFNDIDFINIQTPEGYIPESLPANIELATPYGKYISKIKYENGKTEYYQNIQIFRKRHNKKEYKEIKAFFEKINSSLNRNVVFKKV